MGLTWHMPPPLTETPIPERQIRRKWLPRRLANAAKQDTMGLRAVLHPTTPRRRYRFHNVHPQATCPLWFPKFRPVATHPTSQGKFASEQCAPKMSGADTMRTGARPPPRGRRRRRRRRRRKEDTR